MKQLDIADIPDAASVERAADAFSKIGESVDDAMNAVRSAWSRLAAADVLDIPDSARVFDALSGPLDLASTIGQDAASARSALLAYSTVLSALNQQRPELVEALTAAVASNDVSVMEDYEALTHSSDIDDGSLPTGWRISAFNKEAEKADEDCAEALLKLYMYPGDQAMHALKAVGGVSEGFWGALGIEAGKSAAEKWTTLRDAALSITDARGLTSPGGRHAGVRYLAGTDDSRALQAAAETLEDTNVSTATGTHIQGGAAALKWGGKALGAAGVALSLGVNYAEDYDKNEAKHPEWSDAMRDGHAGLNTVVTTGASLAVSIETAQSGAEMGAFIGTLIEPGGGTVVGAILGGVIGGVAGGIAGGDLGKAGMGLFDAMLGN